MSPTMAAARLVCADVGDAALEPDGASAALQTRSRALATTTGTPATEVGLWEAGPGTDVDVEVDELFLVLAGVGRVTFEDGSSLELRPGTLVRLHAGDRTTWDVDQRLRKLYLA